MKLIVAIAVVFTIFPLILAAQEPDKNRAYSTRKSNENAPTSPKARPIVADAWNPSESVLNSFRNSRLDFRGGLELSRVKVVDKKGDKQENDFGELSGIVTSQDGKTISVITDFGRWFEFEVEFDETGNLVTGKPKELATLREGYLLDETGKRIAEDAEGLSMSPQGILVSFDNSSRILKYGTSLSAKPDLFLPSISSNSFSPGKDDAFEAFASNSSGMYLFTEKIPSQLGDGNRAFVVPFAKKSTVHEFVYRNDRIMTSPNRFVYLQPSGATFLPDKSLLVLERFYFDEKHRTRFNEKAFRISQIDESDLAIANLQNNQIVQGKTLFMGSSVEFDNFEGITTFRRYGKDFVYIVSDDNRSKKGKQKTILALFEIKPKEQSGIENLTGASPTQHAAVRLFELARNFSLKESDRVLAIQQLASATIPATDLIGGKEVHLALLELLESPAPYEIQFQLIKTLLTRYKQKNTIGNEKRQSAVIDGLSKFSMMPSAPSRLRTYVLSNLITIAEKPPASGN